jgi:gas vesicle protein
MRDDYERGDAGAATKLTYLVIGGTIGAVIALLFAPKSGVELRGDIADATKKGLEKGKEAATQIQEKAGEYYEVGKEKAGQITEKARSAAARTSNPFTAAVEAGKDAYATEKRKTEVKSITEGRPTYPVNDETN